MSACFRCGAALSADEMGLYKKLINRGSVDFLCKPCLAVELKVSQELLDEKIAQFRRQGCMLFVSQK